MPQEECGPPAAGFFLHGKLCATLNIEWASTTLLFYFSSYWDGAPWYKWPDETRAREGCPIESSILAVLASWDLEWAVSHIALWFVLSGSLLSLLVSMWASVSLANSLKSSGSCLVQAPVSLVLDSCCASHWPPISEMKIKTKLKML